MDTRLDTVDQIMLPRTAFDLPVAKRDQERESDQSNPPPYRQRAITAWSAKRIRLSLSLAIKLRLQLSYRFFIQGKERIS